ncbi:MAG: hypothetical protein EXS47_01335 [Candidatus Zambryskibacteria bacterium]|nr:hypothetical protein [Candidatus Zambryskibacteria bacterium]
MTLPEITPQTTNLFKSRVRPTNRSPSINSQSTTAMPASPLKNSAMGPFVAKVRKPVVGDPPFIQDFSANVVKPNPNVLSTNAQRNINAITKRKPK